MSGGIDLDRTYWIRGCAHRNSVPSCTIIADASVDAEQSTWAAEAICGGARRLWSGRTAQRVDNHAAEMAAVVNGVTLAHRHFQLPPRALVVVRTDSAAVIHALTRGTRCQTMRRMVAHLRDLLKKQEAALCVRWIKGHRVVEGVRATVVHDRVDQAAKAARLALRAQP